MSLIRYILILIALVYSTAHAQEKGVTIKLDRTEIKIGEQITAELKLVFPVTEDYSFASIQDTITKQIEVVEFGKVDTTYVGQNLSMKVLSSTLLLTSFDTGYLPVPPIYFYGINDSLSTEPFLIYVQDVEVDLPTSDGQSEPEIAIKDIKDIKDKEFSIWEWVKLNKYYLISVWLLIVAIWAFFEFLLPRIRSKEVSIIPQKKVIPPYKIAFDKLTEIEGKKLWQSGKIKEYHSSLSEITREYIEKQFKLPALESTTGEINSALKNNSFNSDVIEEVTSMLQLADLVKFAKMSPLGDENQRCMNQARSFIEKTRPEEVVNKEPKDKEEVDV